MIWINIITKYFNVYSIIRG